MRVILQLNLVSLAISYFSGMKKLSASKSSILLNDFSYWATIIAYSVAIAQSGKYSTRKENIYCEHKECECMTCSLSNRNYVLLKILIKTVVFLCICFTSHEILTCLYMSKDN
jgi:hypothetical protein